VIDKVTLKDLVIRIPFPVKRLAGGVKNINDCFVPGVHYTCTPVLVYGRHIKGLIVANLDAQHGSLVSCSQSLLHVFLVVL
jgi:hypothetical protein